MVLNHQGISALGHLGPNAETVRYLGLDTSVIAFRHFGTRAELSSDCNLQPRQCISDEMTAEAYQIYEMTALGYS